jgi:hypothetical protein
MTGKGLILMTTAWRLRSTSGPSGQLHGLAVQEAVEASGQRLAEGLRAGSRRDRTILDNSIPVDADECRGSTHEHPRELGQSGSVIGRTRIERLPPERALTPW